ncbi:MAG: hypothetical protein IIZ91_02855 [Oscillospiraceae bacterium]|nr:hypothetical protein [Oscillospiraceae bacterium]
MLSLKGVILMVWECGERIDENEKMFTDMLFEVEKCPGAYIGEPSFKGLFYFMGGYELAFSELKGYRLHFDKDFQRFIEKRYNSDGTSHWNSLISSGISDAEALERFYSLLS